MFSFSYKSKVAITFQMSISLQLDGIYTKINALIGNYKFMNTIGLIDCQTLVKLFTNSKSVQRPFLFLYF